MLARAPAAAQLSLTTCPSASRSRGRFRCSTARRPPHAPVGSGDGRADPPGRAAADRVEMRRATDQIVRPDRNGHLVTLRGQDWQPAPGLVGDPE